METIVAAAAQINMGLGKWMLTVSLPAPARHHHIIHPLYELLGRPVGPNEQGFLTSKGRYVGRERAMAIAVAAGQVDPKNRKSGSASRDLFSEDLW
jgi:hypothetical protein